MNIGIDISFAKNVAIAWEIDGKVSYNSVKFEKNETAPVSRDMQHLAVRVFKFLTKDVGIKNENTCTIGIEGQFFGVNPAMVMGLIEIRSLIQGMLLVKYPKINIITVAPRSWQSYILNSGKMQRAEIKKLSVKQASDFVNSNPTEDESDAINILRYILKK